MAQRDIEAIAEAMRAEEAERRAYDKAYEKAQAEEKAFEEEEFEELEDEIIDPASMGFVDSEQVDIADESDDFYNEDFEEVRLNEDVSDCLETKPVEEAEGQATIEVDVYNEDGFGEHFASEVMKNVPGVIAKTMNKVHSNGDITVKISGSRPDLERAFAFYVGERSYGSLSQNDKDEFESLLVFDDGDTLAEADYREAVAHCLDPIGVNASTADLIAQDTCAINMISEECAKRKAKKIIKALNENDLEELSDQDLEQLEGIQDALQNGEGADGMTDDELKVWSALLATMGYTPEEWDKLSPEEKDKAWKAQDELRGQLAKSGFARWLTGIDWTGKKIRYQNKFMDYVPYDKRNDRADDEASGLTAGDRFEDQFNPDYTMEISPAQHPKTYNKKRLADYKKSEQAEIAKRREELARRALYHFRSVMNDKGQKLISTEDFGLMLTNMSNEEKNAFMEALIEYSQETTSSPEEAMAEEKAIRSIFARAKDGKKTLDDLATILTGGRSGAPAALKFKNDLLAGIEAAIDKLDPMAYANAINDNPDDKDYLLNMLGQIIRNPKTKRKFPYVLANQLNSRKTGKNPIDPERAELREQWKKMLRDLGYNPAGWNRLSMDEQLKLMIDYYKTHEKPEWLQRMEKQIADIGD